MKRDRILAWLTAGLLLTGIALRFWDLPLHSLWFDEMSTLHHLLFLPDSATGGYEPEAWRTFRPVDRTLFDRQARVSVANLGRTSAWDDQPPLYFVLAWGWTGVFGLTEAGLRSLSAVLGSLALLLFAWLLRRWLSPGAAVWGTAVFALHPFLVAYSREGRPYALVLLLALVSLALVSRMGEIRPGWGHWTALVLVNTALLYTHYFGAFLLAAEVVGMWPDRRRMSRMLAAQAIAATLFLPGLVDLAGRIVRMHGGGRMSWQKIPDSLSWPAVWLPQLPTFAKKFLVGQVDLSHRLLFAALLVVLGLAAAWLVGSGWRRLRRSRAETARLLAAVVLVPWILTMTADLCLGTGLIASPRYLIYIFVPLIVFLAAGVDSPVQRRRTVALAVLVGVFTLALVDYYRRPWMGVDWRRNAADIRGLMRPGDRLVVDEILEYLLLAWYTPEPVEAALLPRLDDLRRALAGRAGSRLVYLPVRRFELTGIGQWRQSTAPARPAGENRLGPLVRARLLTPAALPERPAGCVAFRIYIVGTGSGGAEEKR
jgi:mannosyltransferase